MSKFVKSVWLAGAALAMIGGCVEHRPVRNGLTDESTYLTKTDLTQVNPKLGEGSTDDGWLYKVTVVKASSPNVVGDYAFPGFESDTKYVKFRFKEDVLQMVDGRKLQAESASNPNDDLSTSTERVMLELAGRHVDLKLRESLDGERTNYLEENTEEPWQKRQKFKIDWEKTSLDPIANMAWFYGDFLHDCASVTSKNLVPDSFEWDETDQHLTWVVEVNYLLKVDTAYGPCYDMTSLATGVGTATIQYRFSFYRPGPSTFVPQVIAEKDPVNKKYGAFQDLNIFRDSETGLLGAKSLLRRFDPNREAPLVFYFAPGFPERFKPGFQEIEAATNAVFERAGAKLRVAFREHDDGGVVRHFGDLRYSFVVWHQDIDTTRGLLGYGPSSSDPRTGELISANLNLYNVGMDYYRYLIQDYLEENGAPAAPDDRDWETVACVPGELATPSDATLRVKSTLFEEMRRTMGIAPSTPDSIGTDDFVPTPARGRDAFLAEYHRTLPEVRYTDPGWNQYVYQPTGALPIERLPERRAKNREFMDVMGSIAKNENPFGQVSLSSREGVEKQLALLESFREWKKNYDQLKLDEEMMLGLKSISVFDPSDAYSAISKGARRCKDTGFWESNDEYRERIIEDVVFKVAIHEFGHNLSLRHNFYGSVDAKHMHEDEVTASVMDYVGSWEEAGHRRGWGAYDEAALSWIYGGDELRTGLMEEDYLYCTDEHRGRSPLCSAHDLGITPSQIVLNAIERYDWLYSIRNQRAFRTFWDTSDYIGRSYNSIFPLLRMWYLAIFDWGGGGVQDTLKRLDQVDPNREVLSDQEYDEISMDFYNDAQAAVGMIIAFYDAVINQPASFRDYQTKFDPFYGDVIQLGIIIDKLFTTFAFMDLQDVYNYNPNVSTYVAMYDAPFGTQNFAISQRVLDNMLGASYDTFPWFKYYALAIFASVTNSNLVSSIELKERIAIRRFENTLELEAELGAGVLDDVVRADNPEQTFVHDGEEYVYTYLADQGWHLVARRSRSPVSFQYMKDYNVALNADASTDEDTFGLKILLAYYEYYNNFVGF
ncbi:zinc-dependent metalloprotease [Myxococcota bacterium]|nr:zinc-dependent metalloprotease [Myxococcota bacterium]